MALTFSYTTLQPEPLLNGTGHVAWYIVPYSKEDAGEWEEIPNLAKNFFVPGAHLTTVNAMPDATAPQKVAKAQALIDLILNNQDTIEPPPAHQGYLPAHLELFVTANDLATTEADAAHDFITVVMGQSYPVRFTP